MQPISRRKRAMPLSPSEECGDHPKRLAFSVHSLTEEGEAAAERRENNAPASHFQQQQQANQLGELMFEFDGGRDSLEGHRPSAR